MSVNSDQDVAGVLRSYSDSRPSHFIKPLQSFSLLTEDSLESTNGKLELEDFEAGGYQWKLVLYPNGNKRKNVKDHISLYLVMARENSLLPGWEVCVDFRLFLLDQKLGKYLVLEDAFTKNFCFRHEMFGAAGFDKLIALKDFTDASNGYLVDDTCVFGAEVFVRKETRPPKVCPSIIKRTSKTYKHAWKVLKFSSLGGQSYHTHRESAEYLQLLKLNSVVQLIFMTSSLNFDDQDGVLRSITDAPPTHYTVKIESLSLLTKNSLEKYESGEFEAGGYKWKLVFYPNGNKRKNVTDHISLYLVMAGANTYQIFWGVHAVFRLFLLDQNTGNYLVFQEQKERRFHGMKLDWGFDKFLSLKAFSESSNGFLMDDTCVFGAEVFVSKEKSTGKGECLSMVKDAVMYKHVWKIANFSKIVAECHDSETFSSGDQKWKIKLYPKGKGNGMGSHLSLYLALADPKSLPPGSKIYTEFTLRILDQSTHAFHQHGTVKFWFSAANPEQGFQRLITLSFLSLAVVGFLLKDTCHVEAEVTVHGNSTALEK